MVVSRGRQRGFDRDAVLDQITRAFWRDGYAGTSVADLTKLTGVNPPSLYAAYGDKRALFGEVLDHYQRTYGAFTTVALHEEPTARRAIGRLLREAAAAYTDPSRPRGCLVISAGTGEAAETLRELRAAGQQAVARRIAADVDAGLLPPGTDSAGLAAFFATVVQGMSRQARDGAGRDTLERVAAMAMGVWPAP
ncbi:AcrR family transcriptional regulator [Actinoplanes octamycinicus]|uniref:AcrR family transcriptional regulator n=1 Tax=Actinoplanes octamycinicus TaxID=135948 RepID=A0A7W7H3I3_9ACTN|nr:TetR/AcrR family transcriptional regulator [Actinoplanes octamycinicus]MBB4743258.1 AcrR family transcriptional regulator [Actinoplanes octamycinicus]GIE63845.1 TetR family transcriptional regulator [Actinoplanes octamycinicus]